MKLFMSLMVLILVGCGSEAPPSRSVKMFVPEEVKWEVADFEDDAAQRGHKLHEVESITFENKGLNGILGTCETRGDKRRIIINSAYWDMITPANKKRLVYHEMGHCALGMSHNDELLTTSGGAQAYRIMNSFMNITSKATERYWGELVVDMLSNQSLNLHSPDCSVSIEHR